MPVLISLAPLVIGFCVDLILGDPHSIPHPVVLIGKLISGFEKLFRRLFPRTPQGRETGRTGPVAVCGGPVLAGPRRPPVAVPADRPLAGPGPGERHVLADLGYQVPAGREHEGLPGIGVRGSDGLRRAVSMIVGRDTQRLDEAGVARAAVETVAENTSDGVVAPLAVPGHRRRAPGGSSTRR